MPTLTNVPASTRPRNSITMLTTDDVRVQLRNGLLMIAGGVLVVGLGAGYLVGRNSAARRGNPAICRPGMACGIRLSKP